MCIQNTDHTLEDESMPIYEYDCPGCGQPFEKRVRMDDADQVECPQCGNHHPKRRLSRISVKAQPGAGTSAIPVSTGST
jgi:putative FmdB family regulatory protein